MKFYDWNSLIPLWEFQKPKKRNPKIQFFSYFKASASVKRQWKHCRTPMTLQNFNELCPQDWWDLLSMIFINLICTPPQEKCPTQADGFTAICILIIQIEVEPSRDLLG